ncbi:hypothetical protein CBS101457_004514 [Exobasidium rhododendri]|nr:hypothetical protein CBS101457_004514 [Exobasidium rhododendri]
MSQLLLSELTALSSESKRKLPEVKAASDAALAAIRSDERSLLRDCRENSKAEEDILLKPIILACSAKSTSAKVISLAVGLLQRIIGIKAVREDYNHLKTIIDILTNVVSSRADIDVHLKALQVVSSLLSNYHSIHNKLLSSTLNLCFRLQDSRIAVVSSTAAATLRQAVMIIFEKVREEDKLSSGGAGLPSPSPVQIPGLDNISLLPCSRDAYFVITDLNALANGEEAPFLSLSSLPRTFTLELIESILTDHAQLFRSDAHPELLFCLRQSTCPLLIKAFNEQAVFPTTLRLMRLLFVLLRQFSAELVVEVEVLMSILLRCVSSSRKTSSNTGGRLSTDTLPTWQRVLAMEATRSLCADGVLLRNLWKWFDSKPNSARVLTDLVDTLHQLATENPAVTGKAELAYQMSDAPQRDSSHLRRPSSEKSYSSIYGAAAGVANAAISGFSNVTDSSTGLSQTSVPGIQLIDQLDKSEAPQPPTSYIYLLALQSLVYLAQSLAAYVLPVYSRFVNSRPKDSPRAPPALDFSFLTEEEKVEMVAVREMLQQCWAPMLHSFTFFLASKCDDILFAEVLIALRNFTNATGVLGLDSPRDALVATLARFAIPRSVIAKLVSLRGKPASSTQEEVECTLSERNAACLKVVTQIAYYLSGSLGTHWRDVLETLCDAEFVLRKGGNRKRSRSISLDEPPQSPSISSYQPKASMASVSALSTIPPGFNSASTTEASTGRPMALSYIDSETLLAEVARVFENTCALGDEAFFHFVETLCELDADSIGLIKASGKGSSLDKNNAGMLVNRSFPLSSLATVAMLNVERLTSSEKELGWERLTRHLLSICSSSLRPSLRLQAADVLDTFLNAALQIRSNNDVAVVQQRALEAIMEQSILEEKRHVAADVDVRRLGLETLLGMLEVHGHSLVLGWEMIFRLCAAAVANVPAGLELNGETASFRSTTVMVKVAFTSLQLVCSDLLSKLDLEQLEECVKTLTLFSKQKEDVNVALTANGTLWAVTAEISARSDEAASRTDPEKITDLWIYVLKSVLDLTHDDRLEVRNGATSILFNILEQYGSRLSRDVWTASIMNEILFPLLDDLNDQCLLDVVGVDEESDRRASAMGVLASSRKQWEESRILALTCTGKIIRQSFIEKLVHAGPTFERLLTILCDAFVQGPNTVSHASIRALHSILQVQVPKEKEELLQAWQMAWQTWTSVGDQLGQSKTLYSQATLLTYIQTLDPLYRLLGNDYLEEDQIKRLLSCLKATLTYEKAKEKISDADRLSHLQSAILSSVEKLQVTPSIASMIIQDLAEYSALAFSGSTQATYLSLNRKSTVLLFDFYAKWSDERATYQSGAVGQIFAALMIPLKLRYDCPRGKEVDAIWKESLRIFCKCASLCCAKMDAMHLDCDIPNDTKSAIWTSILHVVGAALGADCSAILEWSLVRQQEEQVFDLILLGCIECDIWPYLGINYVPESSISELAKSLSSCSQIYNIDYNNQDAEVRAAEATKENDLTGTKAEENEKNELIVTEDEIVAPIEGVPRETFAYWCLDLLLMMSSKGAEAPTSGKEESSRQRTAAIFIPQLTKRITVTVSRYVSEARLRATIPTSRLKVEEINYILHQLDSLILWESTFLVAQGSLPLQEYLSGCQYPQSRDIASTTDCSPLGSTGRAILSSSKGLLYHIYPLLCDLIFFVSPQAGAATCGSSVDFLVPIHIPLGFSSGTIGGQMIKGEEKQKQLHDPRVLARKLLKQIGREWNFSEAMAA